jgi:MFS family permease
MMANGWEITFAVIIGLGLAVDALGGWLSGRAARSKGYSFGLFFGLSFASWFAIATIAVFITPRTEIPQDDASRISLSRILYFIGLGAFIIGPFSVAIASVIYVDISSGAMAGFAAIGAVALTLMGIGLIMGAVATAENKNGKALQNFEASVN